MKAARKDSVCPQVLIPGPGASPGKLLSLFLLLSSCSTPQVGLPTPPHRPPPVLLSPFFLYLPNVPT